MTLSELNNLKPGDLLENANRTMPLLQVNKTNLGYTKCPDSKVVTIKHKDILVFVDKLDAGWIVCLWQSKFILIDANSAVLPTNSII